MPRSSVRAPARGFVLLLTLGSTACAERTVGPPPIMYSPYFLQQQRPMFVPQGTPQPPLGYTGLGKESVPPEVLARFAPQPLPPEQSRRIQAMLDVRAPGAGALTPDGKRMFFTWSVTGTQQIWRLEGPMGFPVQLTGGEDTTTLAGMTPDGKTLFISRDSNGEENPGLYMASPDGGPLKVIQHKPKVQTFLDFVADDGKTILYRANDRKADQFVIYRYDLATQKSDVVFDQPGLFSVADEKGGKLLLEKEVGSNMSEFSEYDPATKALTPLIGQNEKEDYVARYGQGKGEVLVLTPKLGEYRRLYSLKNGKLEPITPELKFDVSSFSIDRARKRILYSVNEGGYTRPYALDAESKKPVTLPKLPKADHVYWGSTTRNGRYTSLQVDLGTAPVQSYVYDWEGSSLKAWHKPSTPEIDTTKFAGVKLEEYPARDGTKIPMFVRRPAACLGAASPCPVIVSFHGGPEAQTLAGFSTRAQLFVDAGFVFVEPNVRGSDGYGKSWIHADDGRKRLAVLTDIEDASKFIRQSWQIGGKAPKIGVYGGSYGGYSTMVAMTIFAGAYDVGVSVVGISSLSTFLINTAPYRRILRISEYGDPDKDKDALAALSPINFVDKVKAPMMVISGATDPRVPVGEALQLNAALVKNRVPTELIVFADEGHGMRKRPNQVLALGHTLRFFEKYLK